jgi:homoserine kinase
MNYFNRFASVATILGLLLTSGLSGSGPTIAVASNSRIAATRGINRRPSALLAS